MSKIPVLVVEDDPIVRKEVVYRIAASDRFEVESAVGTVAAAVEGLSRTRARLGLFDLALPDGSALSLIEPARARGLAVLVLTVSEDTDVVYEAIRAGAGGYLLKAEAFDQVVDALALLLGGGSAISPRIARRLFEDLQSGHLKAVPGTSPAKPKPDAEVTPREREILELFSSGATYREVARMLDISVNTVREHVRNLYDKLHVSTKTEAVLAARDLGKG